MNSYLFLIEQVGGWCKSVNFFTSHLDTKYVGEYIFIFAKDLVLSPDELMISFEVVSLYPNVAMFEIIKK